MFDSGLTYIRADFHLHTKSDKEFIYKDEENSFVKKYIAALQKEQIQLGVITNHNKFNWNEYRALKTAAQKNDIYLLPGIELAIKEGANGVHTLIVFKPEDWLPTAFDPIDYINNFITAVFYQTPNPTNANNKTNMDINSILQLLDRFKKDYFIIFAHVDQSSGLFNECKGGILKQLAQIPNFQKRVLGLQKSRCIKNINQFREIFNYCPALVEGSDPKTIDSIGKGEKCYLKLGAYSFEAIKFALSNNKNRVASEIPSIKHGYIKSLSYKSGDSPEKQISFSPELNTLIGIRGSGKSALLEIIRYVLRLRSYSNDSYKDGLIKHILGDGGIATLTIIDDNGSEYKLRRIYNDEKPVVISPNGTQLEWTSAQKFFNIQYFGQKDLALMSTKENILLNHLNSTEQIYGLNFDQENNMLENCIKNLLDLKKDVEKKELLETNLDYTQDTINLLDSMGFKEKLEKQTAYENDKQHLTILINLIKMNIDKCSSNFEFSDISAPLNDYHSKYNEEIFNKVQKVITTIQSSFNKIQAEFDFIKGEVEALATLRTELLNSAKELSEEFAANRRDLLQTLKQPNPNSTLSYQATDYLQLHAQVTKLEKEISEISQKQESQKDIQEKFLAAISQKKGKLNELYESSKKTVDRINESQDSIKIELIPYGEKDKFKQDLHATFRGSNLSEKKYQALVDQFPDYTDILKDWIIDDGKNLRNLLGDQSFQKVELKLQENYSDLVKKYVENTINIRYHGKNLKDHSLGQRASALILLMLSQKNKGVLIIDQPEDDLDNKVIYDELIASLLKRKQDFQFIFASHNANIPVLGDSEKVFALEYQEKEIQISEGNIDSGKTHEAVINIMEGGHEAFKKRTEIYNDWN